MYPGGFQTRVGVGNLTKHLCGLSRPGHFDGVTTVVTKLFNITKPHLAIFGQKDYQQLTVISRMVRDLNMDIEIVGVPIVRESDGIAMSSRNNYLSTEQRKSALCLKKSLELADEMFSRGETNAENIKKAIEEFILGHAFTKIDYVNLCHPETLEDLETVEPGSLLALAVKVGQTRLIDNVLIGKRSR
jgi:pantoate--beta-alanine ligase